MDIDFDALNTANKALVVAFIVSIFFINLLLIYKTVRNGGFLYKPRSMIIISLAIGDIFLALFSLIVQAIMTFEGTTFLTNCDLYKASNVYLTYLINFVYSVGLILLSVEIVLGYKYQNTLSDTGSNKIKAIFISALPWVLGLVIVLPLTMAETTDTTYEYGIPISCFRNASRQRIIAMDLVCVILPATIAVAVSFVAMCINLASPAPQAINHNSTLDGHTQAAFNIATAPQNYPTKTATSGLKTPVQQSVVVVITAFVFSQCVIPLAVLEILRAYYFMWPVDVVLYSSFLWLSVFRSLITPLIFIGCSKL